MWDLERFVLAQRVNYEDALREMRCGRKQTHWMWYIFPQLRGLGRSAMSMRYGLDGLEEARAYLAHPVLGPRLLECCEAVLKADSNDPWEVFGSPDDLKFRSCLTLFALADPSVPIFEQLLDKFYGGQKDLRTIQILNRKSK